MTTDQPVDPRILEVIRLERALLQPEVRRRPDRLTALLHPDFREFGASGVVWTARAIAQHLASRDDGPGEPLEMEQPTATNLGTDSILLTYQLTSGRRRSLRSSVWVRHDGAWLMLFHQGTHRPKEAGADA